jgi:hypothetical protein
VKHDAFNCCQSLAREAISLISKGSLNGSIRLKARSLVSACLFKVDEMMHGKKLPVCAITQLDPTRTHTHCFPAPIRRKRDEKLIYLAFQPETQFESV